MTETEDASRRRDLHIGQHVVVRTAGNELVKGVIDRVPRDWRDDSGDVQTVRGNFPKAWVRFPNGTVPWPLDDVYSSTDQIPPVLRGEQP